MTTTAAHPLDGHVDGIRRRSNQAFQAVHEALVDDLVSFAFGMLSDRRTAEDVVQQAFVELVKSAHKIRGGGRALRAWLFKSVRYGCLDEYRRRSRRPEVLGADVPDRPVVVDPLEGHLDADLEAALSALSEKHRSVVLLRHVAGLSGEEIAKVIGTTRKAAYAVLSRAESNLRDSLRGEI